MAKATKKHDPVAEMTEAAAEEEQAKTKPTKKPKSELVRVESDEEGVTEGFKLVKIGEAERNKMGRELADKLEDLWEFRREASEIRSKLKADERAKNATIEALQRAVLKGKKEVKAQDEMPF